MTERGATHLKASCVVASHLAERAWAVLNRGTPYVICDTNGNPVTPAQAKKIIAERWTVPEDVRKRRRSRKIAGRPLRRPLPGRTGEATLPAPDRRGPAPRASSPPAHSTPSRDYRSSPHACRPPAGRPYRRARTSAQSMAGRKLPAAP
jgi:hypothetical protein